MSASTSTASNLPVRFPVQVGCDEIQEFRRLSIGSDVQENDDDTEGTADTPEHTSASLPVQRQTRNRSPPSIGPRIVRARSLRGFSNDEDHTGPILCESMPRFAQDDRPLICLDDSTDDTPTNMTEPEVEGGDTHDQFKAGTKAVSLRVNVAKFKAGTKAVSLRVNVADEGATYVQGNIDEKIEFQGAIEDRDANEAGASTKVVSLCVDIADEAEENAEVGVHWAQDKHGHKFESIEEVDDDAQGDSAEEDGDTHAEKAREVNEEPELADDEHRVDPIVVRQNFRGRARTLGNSSPWAKNKVVADSAAYFHWRSRIMWRSFDDWATATRAHRSSHTELHARQRPYACSSAAATQARPLCWTPRTFRTNDTAIDGSLVQEGPIIISSMPPENDAASPTTRTITGEAGTIHYVTRRRLKTSSRLDDMLDQLDDVYGYMGGQISDVKYESAALTIQTYFRRARTLRTERTEVENYLLAQLEKAKGTDFETSAAKILADASETFDESEPAIRRVFLKIIRSKSKVMVMAAFCRTHANPDENLDSQSSESTPARTKRMKSPGEQTGDLTPSDEQLIEAIEKLREHRADHPHSAYLQSDEPQFSPSK